MNSTERKTLNSNVGHRSRLRNRSTMIQDSPDCKQNFGPVTYDDGPEFTSIQECNRCNVTNRRERNVVVKRKRRPHVRTSAPRLRPMFMHVAKVRGWTLREGRLDMVCCLCMPRAWPAGMHTYLCREGSNENPNPVERRFIKITADHSQLRMRNMGDHCQLAKPDCSRSEIVTLRSPKIKCRKVP